MGGPVGERAGVQVEAHQPGHVLGGRAAGDLGGRPLLDDPAVLQHQDPVGEHQRLQRVVGDERHGPAKSAQVPAQLAADLQPGARVEGGQRLVEQQQPRVGGQRPGQRDPLGLPAGELRRGWRPARLGQADPVEPVAAASPRASPRRAPAGRAAEGDVVEHASGAGTAGSPGTPRPPGGRPPATNAPVAGSSERPPAERDAGPPVSGSSPARARSRVVLPAPFGPSTAEHLAGRRRDSRRPA